MCLTPGLTPSLAPRLSLVGLDPLPAPPPFPLMPAFLLILSLSPPPFRL